jgi:hypothetical protein
LYDISCLTSPNISGEYRVPSSLFEEDPATDLHQSIAYQVLNDFISTDFGKLIGFSILIPLLGIFVIKDSTGQKFLKIQNKNGMETWCRVLIFPSQSIWDEQSYTDTEETKDEEDVKKLNGEEEIMIRVGKNIGALTFRILKKIY